MDWGHRLRPPMEASFHCCTMLQVFWLGGPGKHQIQININHSSELTVSIIYSSKDISQYKTQIFKHHGLLSPIVH